LPNEEGQDGAGLFLGIEEMRVLPFFLLSLAANPPSFSLVTRFIEAMGSCPYFPLADESRL